MKRLEEGFEGFLAPSTIVPIQSGEPQNLLQNEKPIHRLMCYRAASGDTPQEIAQATGYSEYQVRDVLKQPRSKILIAQIQQEAFGDDVSLLIRGGATDAVLTLRELSVNAKSEGVRLGACKDILDRYLGKPVSRNENLNFQKNIDPEEEARQIDAQIQQLEGDS